MVENTQPQQQNKLPDQKHVLQIRKEISFCNCLSQELITREKENIVVL